MIATVRKHRQRLSRASLGMFAVLWLGIVIAPCAMAHLADGAGEAPAHHDCPHCPPKPCHAKVESVDCDEPTPVDRLRSVDSGQFLLLLPPAAPALVDAPPPVSQVEAVQVYAARDGPRVHLLHQHFKE